MLMRSEYKNEQRSYDVSTQMYMFVKMSLISFLHLKQSTFPVRVCMYDSAFVCVNLFALSCG